MSLRLYNTLTRTKEEFVPLDPANVRMYVCGPTVYDFAHIGNARPVIVFDLLFRLLRQVYGDAHVTYVRNITDVDDKINARALRDFPNLPLNDAIRNVTEKTANQFFADVEKLGCLQPTIQPRATDNIPQMIAMIEMLVSRRHAYQAAGEVLFSVDSMPDYGHLSQRNLADQQAGARIAVDAHKRNPADFVLWKLSSDDEPGWVSPWGCGRPGWHIECSAMSNRYLGEVFDIHGGGLDLIFPHHENEIAQTRCAFGTAVMANIWMHNGFLQVEGQKMSKSLGNFFTINELMTTRNFGSNMWHGKVLRLAMMMTHYRQPIDWTVDRLVEARIVLKDWIEMATGFDHNGAPPAELLEALTDDLNFSAAISYLHALYRTGRPNRDSHSATTMAAALRFLGLWSGESALDVYSYGYEVQDTGKIDALITARLDARKAKNWAESDRIRDELASMGIAIKDNKDGTTSWEVKR